MRWLINYIRSCFCKHEWELISDANIYLKKKDSRPYKNIKLYRCKKCGYSKEYSVSDE